MVAAISPEGPRAVDGLVSQTTSRSGRVVFQNEDLHLDAGGQVTPEGEYRNYLADMYVEIGLVPDAETANAVLDH